MMFDEKPSLWVMFNLCSCQLDLGHLHKIRKCYQCLRGYSTQPGVRDIQITLPSCPQEVAMQEKLAALWPSGGDKHRAKLFEKHWHPHINQQYSPTLSYAGMFKLSNTIWPKWKHIKEDYKWRKVILGEGNENSLDNVGLNDIQYKQYAHYLIYIPSSVTSSSNKDLQDKWTTNNSNVFGLLHLKCKQHSYYWILFY